MGRLVDGIVSGDDGRRGWDARERRRGGGCERGKRRNGNGLDVSTSLLLRPRRFRSFGIAHP